MLREIITIELEDAGYAVLGAGDGEEAVALLAEAEPDLLLTDIRLPGAIDGWTVARRARAARPALPVFYVTGYSAEPVDLVPGGRLIRKPFSPARLVETIRTLAPSKAGLNA